MSAKSTRKMTKISTPQKLPNIRCHKDRERECQGERRRASSARECEYDSDIHLERLRGKVRVNVW